MARHQPIPETMLVCRTCRQPIEEIRIRGVVTYGHTVNPGPLHHYIAPKVAPLSESEKRALTGDR